MDKTRGFISAVFLLLCFTAGAQDVNNKPATRRGGYSFSTAQIAPGEAADHVVLKKSTSPQPRGQKHTPAQIDSLIKAGAAERLPNGALLLKGQRAVPVPEEEVKAREEVWKRYKQSWVRKPVPDVTFQDSRGVLYRLPQLTGKVVILSFWYNSCVSCHKETGMLEEVARRFQPNPEVPEVLFLMPGVENLPVNDSTSRLIFLPKSGKQARDVFNVSYWPTTFLIDKKGTIRNVVLGSHSGTVEQLSNAIQRMLLE
ncbi:TlpA family protein disulfide reductase [Sabulibacter ruber]|uniref:TlpA family protein disulfide reductase n=1 Tax=Sabulibacter ruber TaxID=2811901 RepID=UPI001A95C8CE|nr:TlpA disulfide reductase family protein [Sabulibacter ruber]